MKSAATSLSHAHDPPPLGWQEPLPAFSVYFLACSHNPFILSKAKFHFTLSQLLFSWHREIMVPWGLDAWIQSQAAKASKLSNSSFHGKSVGVLVTQSCPTLCDPMDYSSPGSSVHGILQAKRILEWVALPSSRGIFLSQGLNLGLLRCRQILYCLGHQGSPHSKRLVYSSAPGLECWQDGISWASLLLTGFTNEIDSKVYCTADILELP